MPVIEMSELHELLMECTKWNEKGWEFRLAKAFYPMLGGGALQMKYRAIFLRKDEDVVGPLADTPEEAIRQLLKAMEEPRYEIEWGFEPDLAEEVGRAIGESIDRWIMSQLVPDITAEITIDDEH